MNGYGGTLLRAISFSRNSTPIRFYNGLGDGQPQTGAAYPQAPGLVGAVEAVKDVGQVFGVYADPVSVIEMASASSPSNPASS